ncbi:hypothetical protein CDAR_247211 [Caerostris darwini]|uniref:Uncharacterized protein n=1 Tax=Caerostris darwini TaxID=1538125 RepID=A0AAV4X1G1_9ARAC|nr:hypothetical protein CDAR_247211 [Caerostris darwini]
MTPERKRFEFGMRAENTQVELFTPTQPPSLATFPFQKRLPNNKTSKHFLFHARDNSINTTTRERERFEFGMRAENTQVELPIDTTAILSNFSFSKDDFPTTKPRSISHSTREATVLIQ